MSAHRQLILTKIMGYLTGEISKNEIYEWALFVAVSSDYEELTKNDALAERIFQFLLDINKPRPHAVPTKQILDYFVRCLEGKAQYNSEEYHKLSEKQSSANPVPVSPLTRDGQAVFKSSGPVNSQNPSFGKLPGWLLFFARIYGFLFLIGSLIMNIVSVARPDLLVYPNELAPTVHRAFKDALPHLIFAIVMLPAMLLRLTRTFLYGFVPVGIYGMFFYWSSAVSYALRHELSIMDGAILLAFVGLPPTAIFFVLLNSWFGFSAVYKANKDG